jgi:hypothetical protein
MINGALQLFRGVRAGSDISEEHIHVVLPTQLSRASRITCNRVHTSVEERSAVPTTNMLLAATVMGAIRITAEHMELQHQPRTLHCDKIG